MSYPVYTVYAGDVLPVFFDTFDGGTGASCTMTGLAVTDIEIYKDGSATQRASDAGYTLLDTDGIDFDSLTGIHGFSIDTGDNTDAGFYAVGSWYHVVVSSVTVDSQTVNFVACSFRIMAAETIAGVPKVDVHAISNDTTAADNLELACDNYSATRGLSGTALPAAAADAAGGLPISDAGGLDIDAKLANTNEVTAARMGALTDWINGGRLDLILDIIAADTTTDIPALIADVPTVAEFEARTLVSAGYASPTNITAGTIATVTNLTNAPTNGDFTAAMKSSITAAVPTAAAIGTDAAGKVLVTPAQKLVTDASGYVTYSNTAPPAASVIADAVWDEVVTTGAHDTDTFAGKQLLTASSAGDPWGTALPGAYGAGTAGKIVGDNINAPIGTVDTVVDGIATTLGVAGAGLTVLATQASVNTIDDFLDTEVAAILADTNELQTDLVNGGRLDLLIDAIKAKTDSLTYTVAGQVDANIQSINDVAITGDGGVGTEFGV